MALIKKLIFVVLSLMVVQLHLLAQNQARTAQKAIAKAVHYDVPSGYQQLGSTDLYYTVKTGGIDAGSVRIGSIDLIGKFGNQYYSSTYSDNGYVVAMHVDGHSAIFADCQKGTTVDGVVFSASIEPQGEMAKIVYTLTNTNDSVNKIVSVGAYDDAYVGNTINASISKKKDLLDNVYGISLSDRAGAQLCVIFGSGLVGVTGVDDYWFGSYSTNTTAEQMAGIYSSGGDSNYMVENGVYDCGIGWCWKNRVVKAGTSITLSYLIAIGDVNLEPNSSFEVTPDDPEGWNDLSRPHRLSLEGEYESPAGQNGKIEYAVEDSEEWTALTDELESGSSFTATLVAVFNPELPVHTIRFRTVDAVGNTSMLTPITYKDVSFHEIRGIEDKTYNWGDSIMQTSITCDLMSDQYEITNYKNNVNAGIASFNIEGVFPYTIGRKTYNFSIEPLALSGNVEFTDDTTCVYSGISFTPEWHFTDDKQNTLVENQDYNVIWEGNVNPGTATLKVQGINNFSGILQSTFLIDKAKLNTDLYALHLPSGDITFDNETHPATSSKADGVGDIVFYYAPSETDGLSENAPGEIGRYDIYVEIADGALYYGLPLTKVGSFTIYQFDESDWATIQAIVPMLVQKGWSAPWDVSAGIFSASSFDGLIIEEGHVTGVNLEGQGITGTFPVELLSFKGLKSLDVSNNAFDGGLEAILAYANQNPAMFANIETIDISGNGFSGNVGAFAAAFPALTSLDVSNNHVSDVYPMISSKVSNLNLEEQTIDKTVEIDLSNLSVEALAQQIPTILLYDHVGQSYDKLLRLKCTADDGWSVVMTYSNGQINFVDVSEQNAYYGNRGDILDVTAMSPDEHAVDAYLSMKLDFDMGDANFDGGINIMDLQSTILFAFDEYPSYFPFNFTAADTYTDGLINVQDVICTANILLSADDVENYAKTMQRLRSQTHEDPDAYVFVEGNTLYLYSDCPVAAIDIAIVGDAQWNLSQYGFMETSTGNHLIGYSLSGITLPTGKIKLGEVSKFEVISKCLLSDELAKPIDVAIRSEVSGIDAVESNPDENNIIYDLNGRMLNSIGDGVNIVVDHNGVRKVLKRK